MESSRTAFLLARFWAIFLWENAFFEAAAIPDHLLDIASYHTGNAPFHMKALLLLHMGRLMLHSVGGLLVWWNAPRVGRWLEGTKKEHPVDAPPLSSP